MSISESPGKSDWCPGLLPYTAEFPLLGPSIVVFMYFCQWYEFHGDGSPFLPEDDINGRINRWYEIQPGEAALPCTSGPESLEARNLDDLRITLEEEAVLQ